VEIDVKAVVRFFGGQAELSRRLVANNTPVNLKTIEQWVTRQSIPMSGVLKLIQLAKSEGRIFEITDFVKQESKQNDNTQRARIEHSETGTAES